MIDSDLLGGILFLTLLCLLVAISVLGTSVLTRLRNTPEYNRPASSEAARVLLGVLLVVIAFMSAFFPYLALLPAAAFCTRAVQAFSIQSSLDRDGGIVLLLVGLMWAGFTAFQVMILASSEAMGGAPIRIDLVLTVPVMVVVGCIGWSIHRSLPAT